PAIRLDAIAHGRVGAAGQEAGRAAADIINTVAADGDIGDRLAAEACNARVVVAGHAAKAANVIVLDQNVGNSDRAGPAFDEDVAAKIALAVWVGAIAAGLIPRDTADVGVANDEAADRFRARVLDHDAAA